MAMLITSDIGQQDEAPWGAQSPWEASLRTPVVALAVSLALRRDLVPAATLLAALLAAPAGGHGLHHHLGLVIEIVVVVIVVIEVVVEFAAVVTEVILGEGELDGLGVLQRHSRGERRHIAAQELRRTRQA